MIPASFSSLFIEIPPCCSRRTAILSSKDISKLLKFLRIFS
nr:MAG TPA: hypothetical protein [Caudoviricetes sp.]